MLKQIIILLALTSGILSETADFEKCPKEQYDLINPWNENSPYNASSVIENFSIEMAYYYSWFASFAYCTDKEISEDRCCKGKLPSKNWEMIDHNFGEPRTFENSNWNDENNYIIFKSDVYKKFVIGFPGTRGGFTQLVEEILKFKLVIFETNSTFKCSSYTKQWFDKIKSNVFSAKNLQIIRQHPDYQIIFTGHSLGGSTASFAALHEEYYPDFSFRNNRPPVVVTFGQNRFGNWDMIKFLDSHANVYRVVRKDDIVAHIPPCSYNIFQPDYCEKSNTIFVHPGHLFALDDAQNNIYHCQTDYEHPSDPSHCNDKVSLGDFNFSHHTNYFVNIGVSDRCAPKNAITFLGLE